MGTFSDGDRWRAPWQRYWSSPPGHVRLGSDGFLVDPETAWGRDLNPDIQRVDLAADPRCLVLLGEPGSGKTTTFEAGRRMVEPALVEAGHRVFALDLHEVGSELQLYRRLFEETEFRAWKESSDELYLFLDSFDECRLQINTLHSLLLNELRPCPTDRLRLRIACRVADWPPVLEQGLRDLWGADEVSVFELAPLRRADVMLAAEAAGIEPGAFVSAVVEVGVAPLAIKPLTLDFLIRSFRRHGTFPGRQAELYRNGCRLLCEESQGRQELRLPRSLSTAQRLAIAEWMAALTVFSNRAAIATEIDRGDVPDEDLPVRALGGGTETADGVPFAVGDEAVKEALNTGLFSSRGERRLGWAHQTYAEFLAARYLVDRDFSVPQIMSLLVHADDPDGKLVPQLHETATWLTAMRADVLEAILTRDPEVVLRSDVGQATDDDRAAVVSALLRACAEGDWVDRDWDLRRAYAKLCHPALAEQLRPYVVHATTDTVVRRVAVHIAAECEERGLSRELAALALDGHAPVDTRVSAAYAVIDIGDEGIKRVLRPLIDTPVEDDPNAELKGCGLLATWPNHLSTSDLLQALTPPQGWSCPPSVDTRSLGTRCP